jgi:hypothetical protein
MYLQSYWIPSTSLLSAARSNATRLIYPSWATPGALGFFRFERGGGVLTPFPPWRNFTEFRRECFNPRPLPPPMALRHPSQRNKPLNNIDAHVAFARFCTISSGGGGMNKFPKWRKIRGISKIKRDNQMGSLRHLSPSAARSNATRLIYPLWATLGALGFFQFDRGGEF